VSLWFQGFHCWSASVTFWQKTTTNCAFTQHSECVVCWTSVVLLYRMLCIRACLDQLLIMIRPSLIVCDHLQSKTRLIAIIRLIAKLGIINTTRLYNGALSIVSLPPHSVYMYRPINTARGEWEGGEWVSQLQQQHAVCWPATTN